MLTLRSLPLLLLLALGAHAARWPDRAATETEFNRAIETKLAAEIDRVIETKLEAVGDFLLDEYPLAPPSFPSVPAEYPPALPEDPFEELNKAPSVLQGYVYPNPQTRCELTTDPIRVCLAAPRHIWSLNVTAMWTKDCYGMTR
jgi:hypothetical protein